MNLLLVDCEDFSTEVSSRVGTQGGLYRLHCFVDDRHVKLIRIPRALRVDVQGILYIGSTKNLVNRLVDLKKTLSPSYASAPHICGRRYNNEKHESLRLAFPYRRLCASFESSATPKLLEGIALGAYCREFGELPPLNSNEFG